MNWCFTEQRETTEEWTEPPRLAQKPSARRGDNGPGDPPDVEGNLTGFMAPFWEVDDFKAAAQSEHEETFNSISTSRLWAFL